MIHRTLSKIAFSGDWGRQMRFISGPRQCGKTTLARAQLRATGCEGLYYLWDLRSIRQRYKTDELFFTADFPASVSEPWVCMDEIHKMPQWKNILKGFFDSLSARSPGSSIVNICTIFIICFPKWLAVRYPSLRWPDTCKSVP